MKYGPRKGTGTGEGARYRLRTPPKRKRLLKQKSQRDIKKPRFKPILVSLHILRREGGEYGSSQTRLGVSWCDVDRTVVLDRKGYEATLLSLPRAPSDVSKAIYRL